MEMRKRRAEDGGQSSEAWMTTREHDESVACFFVLLFAYSAIDAHKFREVVMSLRGAGHITGPGAAPRESAACSLQPHSTGSPD